MQDRIAAERRSFWSDVPLSWRQAALFALCLALCVALLWEAPRLFYPGQLANMAALPASMTAGMGFLLLFARHRDPAACLFALYLVTLSLLAQGNIAGLTTARPPEALPIQPRHFLWVSLLGASPLLFAWVYIQTDWSGVVSAQQIRRLLARLAAGCVALVVCLLLTQKYLSHFSLFASLASPYRQLLLGVAPAPIMQHGFAVWWLLRHYRERGEGRNRATLSLIAAGTLFLLSAPLADVLANPYVTAASNLLGCLVPFLLVGGMERHGLFDIRITLRRAVQYALARQALAVLTVLPLVLLAFLLGWQLNPGQRVPTWFLISGDSLMAGSAVACISLAGVSAVILALRLPLLHWFDRTYFREVYDAQDVLEEVGRTILGMNDPRDIARTTLLGIDNVLHPNTALLLSEENGSVVCLAQRNYTGYQAPAWPAPDLLTAERPLALPPPPLAPSGDFPKEWRRFSAGARQVLQQAGVRLIIPLRQRERMIGALLLGEKRSEQPYLPEDIEMLLALAAQISLALQNARMAREALLQRTQELTSSSRSFVQIMEQERRLLAADLHDQTLPELRCLLNDLEALAAQNQEPAAEPEPPHDLSAEGMAEHLRRTIQDIRDIMESLSPSALEMLGLMAALEGELRKAASRSRPPIRPQFQVIEAIPHGSLSPFAALSVFRIVQEAVTNACRHAQATRVKMQVAIEEGDYVIRIDDDGTGMPPEETRLRGRGLDNMRFRAGLVGARIAWSKPDWGSGTRVELRLSQEQALNAGI